MKKLLALVVMAVAVAGCHTDTAATVVLVDTDSGSSVISENSTRVATLAEIKKVTYSEVEGIRRATVTIQSKVHRRVNLQARMVWVDAEGTEIDPDGKPYRSLILDGMESKTFTGLAPSAKAVTARLQLRDTSTAQ